MNNSILDATDTEILRLLQQNAAYTNKEIAYHLFYRNKLATLPNITTVQSFFVLSETKSDTAYPL